MRFSKSNLCSRFLLNHNKQIKEICNISMGMRRYLADEGLVFDANEEKSCIVTAFS